MWEGWAFHVLLSHPRCDIQGPYLKQNEGDLLMMNHGRHVCGFFPPCPSLGWVLWRSSQSLTSSVGQWIPQRRRGRARIQSRLVWVLSSMPRKEVEVHVEYVMFRQCLRLSTLFSPTVDAPALSLRLMLWCRRCPAKVYFPEKEVCLLRVGAQLESFVESMCFSGFSLLLGLENACLRLGLSVLSFIFIMPQSFWNPQDSAVPPTLDNQK